MEMDLSPAEVQGRLQDIRDLRDDALACLAEETREARAQAEEVLKTGNRRMRRVASGTLDRIDTLEGQMRAKIQRQYQTMMAEVEPHMATFNAVQQEAEAGLNGIINTADAAA